MLKVGNFIIKKRKQKGLTQNELGSRLGVSFQAVSKWERGETLPDTSLLLSLANVLETSVDAILTGGDSIMSEKKKRVYVKDVKKGMQSITHLKELIGKDNTVYQGIIEGVSNKMNNDFEKDLQDAYIVEGYIAEILIQNIMNGYYVDVTEVKEQFEHEHWKNIVLTFINKYDLN